MMNHLYKTLILGGLLVTCSCGFAVARERIVQGLVGATSIDEDELVFKDLPEIDTADVDLPTLFTAGVSVQELIWGEPDSLQLGFECGVLVSFGGDDRDTSGSSGSGTVVVNVDNFLLLTDVFAGITLRRDFAAGPSLYAGAGPLLLFGHISGDFEEREVEGRVGLDWDESDDAFGAGGYVRAGVEFRLGDGSTMGVAVRAFTSTIDFDDSLGEVDIQGVQGLISYSKAL
jgi:hypothetical protein